MGCPCLRRAAISLTALSALFPTCLVRRYGLCLAALLLAAVYGPARAAELTPLEQRYLRGMASVIAFARQTGLPLDVVVQPQAADG